ncbi:MAG: phage holin family protein [Pseudohongiellaceae bacterium]
MANERSTNSSNQGNTPQHGAAVSTDGHPITTGPTDGHPRAEPTGARHDTESISGLVRGLVADVSTLFSKEISLAKAEMREAAAGIKTGITSMVAGAGLAFAGVLVVLLSAVYGLGQVLELWAAALIVGIGALLIGYVMLKAAQRKMEPSAFKPERTFDSVHKDTEATKGAVK